MEYSNSKGEVVVDIESGETSQGARVERDPNLGNKPRKISLNKLVSGVLNFNGSVDGDPGIKLDGREHPHEAVPLLADKNLVGQQSEELVPLVEKDTEKPSRKAAKVKKAPKPPRPPKGPALDAADMRLIREISKIAMKKRERIERVKALKKMKAARLPSPSSSSSFSSSSSGTISAMVITVLFFLVLIFQGLGSSTSSKLALAAAPQPAPAMTASAASLQFYKTVLSDDGAAPSLVPSESVE